MTKLLCVAGVAAVFALCCAAPAMADAAEDQYLAVVHRFNIQGDNAHLVELGRGACDAVPSSYGVAAYQVNLESQGIPAKPDAYVIVTAGITAFCPEKKPGAYPYMN
jgi:hypothetical protein